MKIGVVVMLAENKETMRTPRYAEIRDMAYKTEVHGFDSLWVYDHLFYRPPEGPVIGMWECWTMLSALAEATNRVELGTLVSSNAFRNPVILAKMAATLDEISAGRFTLGIGAGWIESEFNAFGLPFDHRGDRLEEALQIVRPLIKDGCVTFEGQYYQAHEAVLAPRGPRKNGPPILVGCGYGHRLTRIAAKYGDLWNTGFISYPDSYLKPKEKIEAACLEVGRDPATLVKTALTTVAYPELAEPPEMASGYMTGTSKELAEDFLKFDQMGVSHLMIHLYPFNTITLARLARAMKLYKDMGR